MINVDGHPAYPQVIAHLKRVGELGRNRRCRPAPYLNNIGALNKIAGYEAMHVIRKGQVRWLPKGAIREPDLRTNCVTLPLSSGNSARGYHLFATERELRN